MGPDAWFARLTAVLPGDVAVPTGDERAALLDLARVAAHASERWAAPLTTFLAGVAYATNEPADRARTLRALVEHLEEADDGRPQGDRPS